MIDQYGRKIDYLRVSITDRCNLRCQYCMPNGCQWIPMKQILTFEEIVQLCTMGAALGIRKIKVTGGEPLVRKGCVDLVQALKAIDGIEQVTLTTNGVLLSDYAQEFKRIGLDGVNVSLDTLQRERYAHITGRDCLMQTLAGIQSALAVSLPVKVNTVLQMGFNADEWGELVELARETPLDVRFIELMPIGCGTQYQGVSNEVIQRQIVERYGEIQADKHFHGNGPAVYYRIPNFKGSIGFISAIHGKFCERCNRVRLTATGYLKACLCYETGAELRELLRKGETEQVKCKMQAVMLHKPRAHCFERPEEISEQKMMSKIGG